MVVDPWPVIATLSRIDQPLTIPSKAARSIVTVGSVPVTLLVPSTSANESGAVIGFFSHFMQRSLPRRVLSHLPGWLILCTTLPAVPVQCTSMRAGDRAD